MNEPYYPFTTLHRAHRFEFVSVGIKSIRKAILYTATAVPHLYTVALVDIFADGTADDQTVRNIAINKSSPCILCLGSFQNEPLASFALKKIV